MSIINQKEYLKKYLSGGDSNKKKKKKKSKHIGSNKESRLNILDTDVGSLHLIPCGRGSDDDAPTVASITYDSDKTKLRDQMAQRSDKWRHTLADHQTTNQSKLKQKESEIENGTSFKRRLNSNNDTSKGRHDSDDSDNSPPKRVRHDSDDSPPKRVMHDSDDSPPKRVRHDSDDSPPRRVRHDSDDSTPKRVRHDSDDSPPRRVRHDSDDSPLKRVRHESEDLPPRNVKDNSDGFHHKRVVRDSGNSSTMKTVNMGNNKIKEPRKSRFDVESTETNKSRLFKHSEVLDKSPTHRNKARRDSDESPPRRNKGNCDSYESPPRRSKGNCDSDESPPRRSKAGFDSDESPPRRSAAVKSSSGPDQRMEKKMTTEEYLIARKRGKLRKDTPEEAARKEREAVLQAAAEASHERWNRGEAQLRAREEREEEVRHEMGKAFARTAHDQDMNDMLKNRVLEEDPMLEYLSKKRDKKGSSAGPKKPVYQGSFPANRFNLRPGYRWDGVDRSNGFEQDCFKKATSKMAIEEDAYKYCAEDM